MRALFLAVPLSLVLAASPVTAQVQVAVNATSRLDACIAAGAGGAPRGSLHEAVVALRALCGAQIADVRRQRLEEVDARFGGPEARLEPAVAAERARARDAAERRMNNEIAVVVATYTGLTLHDH